MTLYTADRLAEMLGIQRSTVQQLVRAGEFGPRSTWRANTW